MAQNNRVSISVAAFGGVNVVCGYSHSPMKGCALPYPELRLKQQTKDMIYNMQIAPDGKLHFKHFNQQSGYITLQNLLDGKIVITNKQTGQERLFNHVDELLEDGWAID